MADEKNKFEHEEKNLKNKEVNLKKIAQDTYEIPQEKGMYVPGKIFASELLIEKIKQDTTLQQVKNVAVLPGIYKYSLAMSDAHQGYGFPVGGVAAFDTETGCISPGGIGFDINCLTKDTKILTRFGAFKKIQDIESDFIELKNAHVDYVLKSKVGQCSVISFDIKKNMFTSQQAPFFMKKQHSGDIITISTMLGYTIKVTKDHPVLTKQGMVIADQLSKGDYLAVYPFEGVEVTEADEEILVSEELFSNQQRLELESRGLLPLTTCNSKLPILAKLFGYLIGDGSVYISNKKGFVNAYGQKEDLEEIKRDLSELGFSAQIYGRTRNHKIPTRYGLVQFTGEQHELHTPSTSLASLFYALGYPKGEKTAVAYEVPQWIIKAPLWIKRLFLSGLFGAELSTPKTHTKTGFDCPILSMNKLTLLVNNGRKFFIQLMQLLEEFDVKTDKILQTHDFKNKHGSTSRLRLQVSSEETNLLKLWSKIGFSYNKKRELLSQIGIMYVKAKKLCTMKRREIALEVKKLKQKGLLLKEIQKLLTSNITNARFIERHYYENAGQRISLDFISFENFKQSKLEEIKKYGVFFDTLNIKNTEIYDDYVYDLNVKDTHNFIANNIIVSNCGVRVLTSSLNKEQVYEKIQDLLNALFKHIPCGVGEESFVKLTHEELDKVLEQGIDWALEKGYATQQDKQHCEEQGRMKTANAKKVSPRAKKRGKNQLGTLGAGNHFVEVQYVHEIYDKKIAAAFGITQKDQVVVMIHSGSRGLGHQVCSDYLREIEETYPELVKGLPDRDLAYAPAQSQLAQDYLQAMSAAANFGWVNRQLISYSTRKAFEEVFGRDSILPLLYDVAHNIAKVEEYIIDGKKRKVYVHRKGATRAFGPRHKELPEDYQLIGQPILLPGSMGTASYILVGTDKAMNETFSSTPHGAGRVMSRKKAKDSFRGEKIKQELEAKKIYIKAASYKGICEEAPQVYKDVDEVVKVADEVGIGKKVVRLVPMGVIKG